MILYHIDDFTIGLMQKNLLLSRGTFDITGNFIKAKSQRKKRRNAIKPQAGVYLKNKAYDHQPLTNRDIALKQDGANHGLSTQTAADGFYSAPNRAGCVAAPKTAVARQSFIKQILSDVYPQRNQ